MNRTSHTYGGLSVLLTALLASAAHAQATTAATEEQVGLEDIVVTAQKRAENLQTTPVSVTAVSSETLKMQNMTSVGDLQRTTPGLVIGNTPTGQFNVYINIRGQSTADTRISMDPSVGTYLDGVYLPSTRGFGFDSLDDIERVEVLKGPQGTIYGRNTTGGAISIISKKPTDTFEGLLEGGVGNYNSHAVAGVLNMPLGTDVALRVVGRYSAREDGFAENIRFNSQLGSFKSSNLRGTLNARLTDNIEVTVRADWAHGVGDGAVWQPVRIVPYYTDAGGTFRTLTLAVAIARANGLPLTAAGLDAAAALYMASPGAGPNPNLRDKSYDQETSEKFDAGGASLTLDVDTGGPALKYISAYRWQAQASAKDLDASPFAGIAVLHLYSRQWQVTQELQATGDVGDSFKYVGGAYYYYLRGPDNSNNIAVPNINTTNPSAVRNQNTKQSVAIYGQGTYTLAQDLHLTLGLRYTDEQRGLIAFNFNGLGCNLPPAEKDGTCRAKYTRSENNLSFKAGLDYRFTTTIFGYANVSRGFKSGGNNQTGSQLPGSFAPFAPERVTQFETGLKSEFLDRRLRFNVAGYYTDYKNIQRSVIFGVNTALRYQNAASARVYGMEAETAFQPVRSLTLSGTLAYTNAHYKKYTTFDGFDHSNQLFQQTPKWTYSLAANHVLDLGDFGELKSNLSWSYRSLQDLYPDSDFFDPSPSHLQKGYGLLNARIGLTVRSLDMDVAVWGKNLLDKRYKSGATNLASPGSLGQTLVVVGDPRTFGVTATKRF